MKTGLTILKEKMGTSNIYPSKFKNQKDLKLYYYSYNMDEVCTLSIKEFFSEILKVTLFMQLNAKFTCIDIDFDSAEYDITFYCKSSQKYSSFKNIPRTIQNKYPKINVWIVFDYEGNKKRVSPF